MRLPRAGSVFREHADVLADTVREVILFSDVPRNTPRHPGRYYCGCRMGTGAACPKMSCPGKWESNRSKGPLDSERYLAEYPL